MIKVEVKTEGSKIACQIEIEGKHGDVYTELGALLAGICQSMEEEHKGAGVDCIAKALDVMAGQMEGKRKGHERSGDQKTLC